MRTLWVLGMLLLAPFCSGARILVLQPMSVRSHAIVYKPLFEELAARGHQLTIVTSNPHETAVPNIQEIDFSYLMPPLTSNFSFELIRSTMPNPFITPMFMMDVEIMFCEKVFAEAKFQNLLQSTEKFDLVITEIFSADCFVPFAHKFNAPLVSIVTSYPLPWLADRVGLPDNPSYIPNYLVNFPSDMTFFQRMYNSINLVYSKLLHNYYAITKSQNIISEYFDQSTPPLGTLLKNTSLVFTNCHFSTALSRPFPPTVVEVGGIHVTKSTNTIDKDLLDILDQSTQGAILVSFGSMVRTASMPRHLIEALVKSFSAIPQTVIFKYEDELSGISPNIVTRKWLPQQEIIAHKNVKLILAHGGMASTIEAVHFGKPLIGIPFYSDQYLNIQFIATRGAGVVLDLNDLTEHTVGAALKEVLEDSSYSENMRRLSVEFRDRPMTPLDTAVYWTEYVIRHQGAPQLRPASVDLALHQYLLLDVAAVLLLPFLPLLYLIYFLFFRAVEVSPNDIRYYETKKND